MKRAYMWILTVFLFLPLQVLHCEPVTSENWRGVHLWVDSDKSAQELVQTLPALEKIGVNALVVEVNYSFEFQSHPEMRNRRFVSVATAHELARAARSNGIVLIPQFNCLGHQSFAHRVAPLLIEHPEFNETPSQSLTNKSTYCLSWCPRADGLHEIIFSLIDEMAAGFEAAYFHVGMDEVYLIGETECPRCKGRNPAKLFSNEVLALHDHIVKRKKLKMLMWSDRIIGVKFQGTSQYDTPHNDLSPSIDRIPRDIIQCDWHYEWRKEYPSLPYLAGKGFRIWPSGFTPVKASQSFSDYAHSHGSNVIGYLATTWNQTTISNSPNWPPIRDILPSWTGSSTTK